MIAAGSTGSMPATASLLATIAKLPHGAVVLPGLDTDLDESAWDLIGEIKDGGRVVQAPASGHPQLAMHALLRRIGIARDEVTALAPSGAREKLTSEAMRPSGATEHWAERIDDAVRDSGARESLGDRGRECRGRSARHRGRAARGGRENGNTAALVTPDRALARRVTAALARWNIEADDSGGDALPDTEAGVFARLAAQGRARRAEPRLAARAVEARALPARRMAAGAHAHAIAALEMAVLRGPRPAPGSAGLAHALATFRANRSSLHRIRSAPENLKDGDLDSAQELVRAARRRAGATRRHQGRATVHRNRGAARAGAGRAVRA